MVFSIENYWKFLIFRQPPVTTKIIHFTDVKDGNDIYFDDIFESRVFLIRISNGCLGDCSYCAIKKAIGPLKSKELSIILDEVEFAIKQGYSYIRFIADDGGAYGLDLKLNVINLLNEIGHYHQVKGIEMEINPKWMLRYKDEFVMFMKTHSYLAFKISIPIQSASEQVLSHMNRGIAMAQFTRLLTDMKKNEALNLFLITHIIVGYPTETQEDLNTTITFLVAHRLNQINVFPFTLHPQSKIGLVHKLPKVNIQERTNYLVNHLCANGYEIIDFKKNTNQEWQHIILRIRTKYSKDNVYQ